MPDTPEDLLTFDELRTRVGAAQHLCGVMGCKAIGTLHSLMEGTPSPRSWGQPA